MKTPPCPTASPLTLLALLLLALVAEALVPASVTAQGADMVRMEVIPVQGNVYMLQTPTAGGNIGVLPGPDGILLVDDQVERLIESVVRGVREITDEEIRFVVNTHLHRDHRGGNEVLADMGATLIAHDNVRLRMLGRFRGPRGGGLLAPVPPERALQILTFSDAVTFHMNGEEVRVFLAPPHTPTVTASSTSWTRTSSTSGTCSGLTSIPTSTCTTRKCVGDDRSHGDRHRSGGTEHQVIPGHGSGFTDRDGLIEVLTMLVDLWDKIREMIIEGMQFDEVVAANPTAEYDEKWDRYHRGMRATSCRSFTMKLAAASYRRPATSSKKGNEWRVQFRGSPVVHSS